MSKILEDETIRDFFSDFHDFRIIRSDYVDAHGLMSARLPAYVKRFRNLAHRMTQAELASALGVDHSYISKIENGHEIASAEFLDKFAKCIALWEDYEE
jgi:DNA-binding XRE family transcriptional regulator